MSQYTIDAKEAVATGGITIHYGSSRCRDMGAVSS